MTDCDEERVREIYEYIDEQEHLAAYLFVVDGTPVGLLQTYDPEVDEIGEWYDRRPGDVGVHLLLADDPRRAGRTEEMIAAALSFVCVAAGLCAAGLRAGRPQRGLAGDDGADRCRARPAGRHEDEHHREAGPVLLPGAGGVAEGMNQAGCPGPPPSVTSLDKKESLVDINRILLTTLLDRIPEAWDAVIPHGHRVASILDLVALNPQPLPPVDQGIRFGRSLVQLAFVAEKIGQPVTPLAEWSNDDVLDNLGAPNPVLAALIAELIKHGGPVPDDEPKPHWKNEVLAGVALGLATAGDAVETERVPAHGVRVRRRGRRRRTPGPPRGLTPSPRAGRGIEPSAGAGLRRVSPRDLCGYVAVRGGLGPLLNEGRGGSPLLVAVLSP